MVAASDEEEEVQVEVSAEWCVTVEHQRSSSIRDYLCRIIRLANYSVTTSLIYKLIR